jgi:TPR repeat protein
MGQVGLPPEPEVAIPLLRRAASLATIDAPQAAYVFGMLLAGEFEQLAVAPHILLPPGSQPSQRLATQHSEARALILRAAYLCFAPAQYKAAYLYEHAQLGCVYDPLLSVQYYSLASQNGEIEADMALSKWFLVGAEGSFDKNEPLARTFAQKAAKAGLASGCFALGYYYE